MIISRKWGYGLLLFILPFSIQAQSKKEEKMLEQLRTDIGYLASDELEGRATGSEGEQLAAEYLQQRYTELKIKPFKENYQIPFNYIKGRSIGPGTRISLNGFNAIPEQDAFPLPFSESQRTIGDFVAEVQEPDNLCMIPLYDSLEQANDPHYNWEKSVYTAARSCAEKGMTGVIVYENYPSKYELKFNTHSDLEKLGIPCILIKNGYYTLISRDLMQRGGNTYSYDIETDIIKTEKKGINVAAYIDNGKPYTVIIGAHMDHLGYGEEGSLYRGKEKMIHNGADDNASGTAGVLYLAETIKKKKLKQYNYLFVHFSGEELGLLGSKAFVKDMDIDSTKTAWMLNMDMIGRLNDSTQTLTVGGVGTSPLWSRILFPVVADFRFNKDSSGIGPSDHTSFYNKGIPVVFLFTGAHSDYHKPGDDAEKVNYEGELKILKYAFEIIEKADAAPKPRFTATKNNMVNSGVRFKVTLGIVPDYAYNEEDGLRIDGVSDGKTAQVAGMQAGDIITGIGSYEVRGIQSYMEALSKFSSGNQTTVTYRRNGVEATAPIVFQ